MTMCVRMHGARRLPFVVNVVYTTYLGGVFTVHAWRVRQAAALVRWLLTALWTQNKCLAKIKKKKTGEKNYNFIVFNAVLTFDFNCSTIITTLKRKGLTSVEKKIGIPRTYDSMLKTFVNVCLSSYILLNFKFSCDNIFFKFNLLTTLFFKLYVCIF